MLTGNWPNPPHPEEYAIRCDSGRETRILIVPALFDEANKLRHFIVETMRILDGLGMDCMLPDLPGTNESQLAPVEQDIASWHSAMSGAARHFGATHALSLRGGANCVPDTIPALRYAPIGGSSVLRALLRAQVIADREASKNTSREDLLARGRECGLVLAGYALGPDMIAQLENAELAEPGMPDIAQGDLGGAGLWLRAEPDHDQAQAQALAKTVQERLR